ncbi:hypothetical protein ACS2TZ_27125 [Bacillus cereus group sp. Bce025]|nr:hypothetical protein [Bacillus cereus]MDA2497216.1 hypothetical protein [Bacillus cereus]MRC31851.1 hypothetical protein [Bacillus thuringiensis]
MNKISLWENCYDSINHGLSHLEEAVKTGNIFDYKRAVLDFSHAAELLLKEMLFRINPVLVFDKNHLFEKCLDPMNPTLDELYNCKSLEVNPLCNAVKKYIPEFEGNFNIFSSQTAKLRNKIQHFCFTVDKDEIREILLKLSYQLLCPAFHYLDYGESYDPIENRLRNIFSCDENMKEQISLLKKIGSEYELGVCFACGSYSFFIEYNGKSYPERCYCTSCNYSKEKIHNEIYYVCPECTVGSLLYCKELDGGICLNYKCANHRDGGILTPMEWCYECQDYRIEDECSCMIE